MFEKAKHTPKLKFGDIVENGWASEDNPIRTGIFIRFRKIPHGQMNAGYQASLTDGKGRFWETSAGKENKLRKIGSCMAYEIAAERDRLLKLVRDMVDGIHSREVKITSPLIAQEPGTETCHYWDEEWMHYAVAALAAHAADAGEKGEG